MAAVSPLHAFDNQLWEKLLAFVKVDTLWALVLTGDRKVVTECIRATRSLAMSCKTIECYILSRALVQNLESLTIFLPSRKGVRSKNYPRVLQMVSSGSLTELVFSDVNSAGLHFTLPPTLKKLSILTIGSGAFKSLSLGKAKLVHLRLEHSYKNERQTPFCQWLIDILAIPSAATLEHLTVRSRRPVSMDLSQHLLLSSVLFNRNCVLPTAPFLPPPGVRKLTLEDRSDETLNVGNIISLFGPSLVKVKLDTMFLLPKVLDISRFGQIESLEIRPFHHSVSVICAPSRHLHIAFTDLPEYVINNGPGTVSITGFCLPLRNGNLPAASVLNHLDWSTVKSIKLQYYQSYGAQNVDYSILGQAHNLTTLHILNDTMQSYAARDGPRFMQQFPQLCTLRWHMDNEVCSNLSPSGFVLPTSVTYLEVRACGEFSTLSDSEHLHLLDWMRHAPKTIYLRQLPLIPKIVDLCNDANSSLRLLDYECDSCIFITTIWSDHTPTFAPSPHLNKTKLSFFGCEDDATIQTLKKVFGSFYCEPEDSKVVILYTTSED